MFFSHAFQSHSQLVRGSSAEARRLSAVRAGWAARACPQRGRLQVLGSAWGHRAWCREWEPRIARVPVTLLGSPHHLHSSPPRLLGLQPPIQLAGCDTPVGPPLGSRGSSEQHFAGARGPAAVGAAGAVRCLAGDAVGCRGNACLPK